MCGLTGWFSTLPERFEPDQARALAAMQSALRHRGPDGRGAHLDGPRRGRQTGVALGFTRLAIRDLQHGAQPMAGGRVATPAERVVATLNGELYDETRLAAALRDAGCDLRSRCDAELLAHGAAVWGDAVWPRLEGMFAAVVWRPKRGTLTLARDGSGQKPLYVALVDDGRTALWGSEIGALLAHPSLRPELDPRGVDALLWLDYVPAPGSLLRGVYKLPPGAIWTLNADEFGRLGLQTTTIQAIAACSADALAFRAEPAERSRPWRFDDAVDALDARLERAVRRRLVSDVPIGIFLSGGVDSSLVAHYAAQAVKTAREARGVPLEALPLETLSIRFDDPSFDESAYAREVADHLGTDHREIPFSSTDALTTLAALLDAADEPLADPSRLVTQHLCAKSGLKVALGGDGGDEAWLGYPTFTVHGLAAALGRLPPGLLRGAARLGRQLPPSERNLAATEKARRFLDGLAGPAALRGLTWIGGLPPDQLTSVHDADPVTPAPWDDVVGWGPPVTVMQDVAAALRSLHDIPLDAERALLARTYLAEGVLQKVDRASMAHGVEVRAPWLDRDVLSLAAALPPALLLRRGRGKRVPRALAARHLPKHVATRPKKGFGVPLSAWLRGPMARRLQHDLRAESVAQVPGLRPAAVSKLVQGHLSGRADHRKTLFALWQLVVWWRGHCQ